VVDAAFSCSAGLVQPGFYLVNAIVKYFIINAHFSFCARNGCGDLKKNLAQIA